MSLFGPSLYAQSASPCASLRPSFRATHALFKALRTFLTQPTQATQRPTRKEKWCLLLLCVPVRCVRCFGWKAGIMRPTSMCSERTGGVLARRLINVREKLQEKMIINVEQRLVYNRCKRLQTLKITTGVCLSELPRFSTI